MVKKSEIPKAMRNPKKAVEVGYSRFNMAAGKMLFKNTAGLEANIQGWKTRHKMKKTHNKVLTKELQNPLVSEIKDKGYVNLGCPFDKNTLNKIIEKYNIIIEDDRYSFVRSQYKGKTCSRMVNRTFRQIPEVKDLLTPKMLDMVEEYYSGNFQVIYTMMWRNYHVPPEIAANNEIFSSYWHCDGADTTASTLYINLTEVKDDDGPLHLQSKSRTKELVKMGFNYRSDYNLPDNVVEDPKFVVKHTGASGSAIWANTCLCLHRAGIPEPEHYRDILQFRFLPSEEPLRERWTEYCIDSHSETKNDGINVSNPSIT